jgi:hypothetical protein
VKTVEELMKELGIDSRVVMEENQAPDTTEERKVVLEFYDAIVRGDHASLGELLGEADKHELDDMVASGDWQRATGDAVKQVTVQCGSSEMGKCTLGLFETGAQFQPQLWYYMGTVGDYRFEAAASPPGIVNRLSGSDWIAAWHKILAEELALADQPDDNVGPIQVDLTVRQSDGTSSAGGQGPAKGRRGPGDGPKQAPPSPGGPGDDPLSPGGR